MPRMLQDVPVGSFAQSDCMIHCCASSRSDEPESNQSRGNSKPVRRVKSRAIRENFQSSDDGGFFQRFVFTLLLIFENSSFTNRP
jgi:hypothetical protein